MLRTQHDVLEVELMELPVHVLAKQGTSAPLGRAVTVGSDVKIIDGLGLPRPRTPQGVVWPVADELRRANLAALVGDERAGFLVSARQTIRPADKQSIHRPTTSASQKIHV